MTKIAFAIPGDLMSPTGGYAYDRRIIAELAGWGFEVEVIGLGDGFPAPSEEVRRAALARILEAARTQTVVVDGLALGVLPELGGTPGRMVALVHHPLAYESGLDAAAAARLRASETAALAGATEVIVSSATTAWLLAEEYGVPAEQVTVVRPGTEPAPPARGSGGAAPALLAVGSVVPRKGYDVLIAALADLADLAFHLTIVGDRGRDLGTASAISAQISAMDLTACVTLAGAVPEKELAAFYAGADLFVLASRYEGYGMAYADAIAHGLPVVGCDAGAVREVVGDAGILVPPDDPAALAAALRPLISDAAARERLAARARMAASRLPRWAESGRQFAAVLTRVAAKALP